jgi:hypothetical protein
MYLPYSQNLISIITIIIAEKFNYINPLFISEFAKNLLLFKITTITMIIITIAIVLMMMIIIINFPL